MKKVIFLILLFTSTLIFGQEPTNGFVFKKNQHSISASYAALSYSYAHQFKQNLTLGVSGQIGFAHRYYIIGSSFRYNDAALDYNGKSQFGETHEFGDYFVDLLKVHFFYRPSTGDHFFFDLGPYFSFGYLNTLKNTELTFNNGGFSAGLEAAAYYRFRKTFIGTKISMGYQILGDFDKIVDYFGVFSTPIVIGYNF